MYGKEHFTGALDRIKKEIDDVDGERMKPKGYAEVHEEKIYMPHKEGEHGAGYEGEGHYGSKPPEEEDGGELSGMRDMEHIGHDLGADNSEADIKSSGDSMDTSDKMANDSRELRKNPFGHDKMAHLSKGTHDALDSSFGTDEEESDEPKWIEELLRKGR